MTPGTIISVPAVAGFVRHVGIVCDATENGQPMIISNSQKHGCVNEEPLAAFAEGNTVRVEGFPGAIPAEEVVARARQRLGQPWRLFASNCEHFVRECHGLRPGSPQLVRGLLLTGLGFALRLRP